MMTREERFASYVRSKDGELKIMACMNKASGRTVVSFLLEQDMLELLDMKSNALAFKDEGIKWTGRMVNKLDVHKERVRLTIPHAWNKFVVGKNGFMSDDQEQSVMKALNEGGDWYMVQPAGNAERCEQNAQLYRLLRSVQWTWEGHNHRRGVHDLKAILPDGTVVWVEVKGINARVYYS